MNLPIVILNSLLMCFVLVSHLFECLATVVSRLWVMLLKCPWNCVKRGFFVSPTYCIPQVLHVITYIRLELWQFTLDILVNVFSLLCDIRDLILGRRCTQH